MFVEIICSLHNTLPTGNESAASSYSQLGWFFQVFKRLEKCTHLNLITIIYYIIQCTNS